MLKFYEKLPRSIVKTITWRIIATITLILIGFIVSGSWKVGFGAAGFALVINNLAYFFHERFWNRLDWGKYQVSVKFTEKIPRTIAKLISWRVVATILLVIGGFIVSGSWTIGAGYAGLSMVVNSIAYFLHDRAWNKATWGKEINNV
jgi:uncharacterized membrane protein